MSSRNHSKLEEEYQKLRGAKARHLESLLSLPNVNGVGIGRKVTEGERTDVRAIRVYVVEKKPRDELHPHEVVPPELDGLPTDVVQVGQIRPLNGAPYTYRERPAQGGASLHRADRFTAGTLGCLCIDDTDGDPVILSCNHVMALADDTEHDDARAGDLIIQPGRADGGTPRTDIIALLKRWGEFELPPAWNKIDAAIAQIIDPDDASPFIHQIGQPSGWRRLQPADEGITVVQKCGRTTGHTQGLVEDVECTVSVTYGFSSIHFMDQVLIGNIDDQPFVLEGDSGSVALDTNNNLVGLLFARGDTCAYMNHIDNVLEELDVALYSTSNVHSLASDGENLYAALTAASVQVVKINPTDMITVATWSNSQGGANVRALACNGDYLFAALHAAPVRVEKIGTTLMQSKATWAGQAGDFPCYALTLDEDHLYVGMATLPARVVKVKVSDMATVATWTGESGQDDCQALTFDGSYIHVGLNTSPAKVIQLDPTDMTTYATWEGTEGQNGVNALFFDGSFLYVALGTSPGQVVKVDPWTMTTLDTWTVGEGEASCIALTSDSLSLYAGLDAEPAQVVKIDRDTMTTISTWTGTEGGGRLADLLFDGLFTFISLTSTPATVVRKILRDVDETET